jgi:hypothetical protein
MFRFLPLFAGVVPIAGIAAAYWLNVEAGLLPACMPLLDGCTSISATGRMLPGSMPFRAVLLPQAALLAFLWRLSVRWLEQVRPESRAGTPILICGATGAIALVLYVTFLGTEQPFYEFMRRFGIYFYFLGTALSQILLTLAISPSRLRTAMLWVIGTPLVLGLINLAQKVLLADSNGVENSIEWASALLMQLWFVLLFFAWRRTGIGVTVYVDSTNVR